jgi:hypothetical protein
MFEADAEKFRRAGFRIGADQTSAEQSLLEENLAPFPVELRNHAMRMIRLYGLLYCFENSVRQLIRERLTENIGSDWWETATPPKIRSFAETRREKALSNTWLEGEKGDLLQYVELGHLSDLIIANWERFSDLVPSQHWLKQRFDEIEQARNFVAHNRLLMPSEFARLEQYISDWRKQVGF